MYYKYECTVHKRCTTTNAENRQRRTEVCVVFLYNTQSNKYYKYESNRFYKYGVDNSTILQNVQIHMHGAQRCTTNAEDRQKKTEVVCVGILLYTKNNINLQYYSTTNATNTCVLCTIGAQRTTQVTDRVEEC